MRILIVSFCYAPMVSPQAYRWSQIARSLVSRGHKVLVVAGWEPGCERHTERDGLEVRRVGGAVVERLRGAYVESKYGRAASGSLSRDEGTRKPFAVRIVKAFHDMTWKQLYWPDAHCSWIPSAIRTCDEEMRVGLPDIVVTVGLPFSAHVVGLRVISRHSEIGWLCDMSDPFSYLEPAPPNNGRLYGRLNRWMERRVFDRADSIAVTCDDTQRRYSDLYPGIEGKLSIVPHLMSGGTPGPRQRGAEELERSSARPLRLVFVGTLDGRCRDPRPLLDICQAIADRREGRGIELHLYGKVENCDETLAEFEAARVGWLFVHGQVNQEAAMGAVAGADVLVNVGNVYQCQLPSKLVDYGATGKPILNVVSTGRDLSREALRGYRAALTIVCGREGAGTADITKISAFLNEAPWLDVDEARAWSRKFSLPEIVTAYEALFETAIAARRQVTE